MNFKSPISNFQTITAILACALFLASCVDKTAETSPPIPKKEEARLVGRIASVNKDPDFVLIQSYGSWKVQTGVILATFGSNGRAANLKVTGEKTGQFAAADIQSGTLEIGDSVYTTLTSESIDVKESEQKPQESETPIAP